MPKRKRARSWPPKGSYPHPHGGYIGPTTRHHGIQITGHLKAEPDTRRLAELVVRLAEQLGKRR